MIYFDNAAETLPKPPRVIRAMAAALETFGNPGRSHATPAMLAAREILQARQAVAGLVGLRNPMRVAFTSGFTEAMGLLARQIQPGEPVLVTEVEHNSVLRPLMLRGARLRVLPCDEKGNLRWDQLEDVMEPGVRYAFLSHGSNVTGNLTDVAPMRAFCQERGVTLVLDVAQTLGCAWVHHNMADILCFTGHKALLGPQGTGGLIVGEGISLPVLKTGGTGGDSFQPLQPDILPDAMEAGTPNAHGLAGLRAGVEHGLALGLDQIMAQEQALTECFLNGLSGIKGLRLYGDGDRWPRLPVVAFALEGMDSAEVALRLWEDHKIATRSGSHCAPLLHKRLGTEKEGLVRCSFSIQNTMDEVWRGVEAVRSLAMRASG